MLRLIYYRISSNYRDFIVFRFRCDHFSDVNMFDAERNILHTYPITSKRKDLRCEKTVALGNYHVHAGVSRKHMDN